MSDDVQIWGVQFDDGTWPQFVDEMWFTFSEAEAQARAQRVNRLQAIPLPDEIVARHPKAAAALIAMYQIRTARIIYQQAAGWKPEVE